MSVRERARRAVAQAAAAGSLLTDSPDERLRKSALVLSSLLITFLSFIWVGTYAALGLWGSALIPLAYQVASLVGLAFFARTKRYSAYRASQVAMMLLLPFLLQWSIGGFVESGAVALWAFVAPLGALVFYGPRQAIAWFGAFLALVAVSAVIDGVLPEPSEDIPSWVVVAFFALNIMGPAVTTFALLEHFVRSRDRAREFGESHEVLPGHFWTTLEETLLGFLLAAAAGILLAVLIAYSRILERTIYPILLALQSVPKVAIAPLLVLWMGFGAGPKIVMVFLLALFPIVISTATGLKQTPPEFIDLIRSLSASQLQAFWKVRFPAATPHIFVGLKVGITLAVIGAVIGEFVGAREGLGFLIIISGANVNTSLAFVSIVLLSVMSIGLFYALVALERLLAPWGAHMREGE